MLKTEYYKVATIDEPEILDCTVTPIPGSGSDPLQIVASLSMETHYINFLNTTGKYVGLFRGAPGQEHRLCLCNKDLEMTLNKGDRIAVRNLEADTISRGSIHIQFIAK